MDKTHIIIYRACACVVTMLIALAASAQRQDSTLFRGYLVSDEANIYMDISLQDADITLPGYGGLGTMPGYMGRSGIRYYWFITSADIEGRTANIEMINGDGSEDLTATLTLRDDSTYTFTQKAGSPLKMPLKGKFVKLPKTFTLRRK